MSYAIQRPTRHRPLPDSLYAQVATAYKKAAAEGRFDPRKRIADDSGLAPGTVSRWIAEARNRGLLEPTTRGKVSGRKPFCRTCGRPL